MDLVNAKEVKLGVCALNSNFNIGGIVLGLCLMSIAIGIRYKKRFAFLSAIVIYSLFLAYGVFVICYFLFTPPVKLGLIFLITVFLIYSVIVIIRAKAYISNI
ncbi:MAG: hypothetical protein Q8920_10900 [Bacillota bacterium]|nr:hypothetical protein [Bacillota bacterium]